MVCKEIESSVLDIKRLRYLQFMDTLSKSENVRLKILKTGMEK